MKRPLIVFLGIVNLVLIALLIVELVPSTAAYAQATARPGDYSCVTAKPANQAHDVMYVLDRPNNLLHAFYPTGNARQKTFQHAAVRNLEQDFTTR